jgi:CBS domain-containing protein
MVKIKEIMSINLVTVEACTTVREAVYVMAREKLGSLLVSKGGEIVGVVEERDIIDGLVNDLNPYVTAVEAIMSVPLIIDEEQTDNDGSDMMFQHKVRHLAVSDGEKIVGILSMADLLRPIYAGKSIWA